jgi:hypothetical protein
MIEFADIFSYDLNTVILAGPVLVLWGFALFAAYMDRVPEQNPAFQLAPEFGR